MLLNDCSVNRPDDNDTDKSGQAGWQIIVQGDPAIDHGGNTHHQQQNIIPAYR